MRTVYAVIREHEHKLHRGLLATVSRLSFAEGLSAAELTSVLPAFVRSLGAATDPRDELTELQQIQLERHLRTRLRQGATLNEILTEFAALSRLISEVLGSETEHSAPTTRDTANVFGELNLACLATIRIFREQLLEDEQPMKRYLRLLRDLVGGHGTVDDAPQSVQLRLRSAMSLIMRAMEAQTAAILLFDSDTDELIASAAVGDAGPQIEDYVQSVHDVHDVRLTTLQDTNTLAASGVRAFVGVPITEGLTLRGVLYIGLRDRDTFLASELRELETLGLALITHIDHARLCAALRAKAYEAIAECELRERLVLTLTNDLAEPLAGARANAMRLVNGDSDVTPAISAAIMADLDRISSMVEGLVDAHVEHARDEPFDTDGCDLRAVARDAVEPLRAMHGDRFVIEGDETVAGMWSAGPLRRAIWNLVANAIHFGARDATVRISVTRGAEFAELAVHNQGPPISHERQVELFRPFSATTPGNGQQYGLGLGLALIWGCANAHGGRVTVTSSARNGTTFTLLLPYDTRPYPVGSTNLAMR